MPGRVSTSEETLQQAIDQLWETIPPVWSQIRGNVRAIASERFDISVQQFRVLRHIRTGIGSASELAAVSQTSRPAISQCVDALAAKGLVTRRQSAQDRRCVELELTASGRDMLSAIFEENRRWLRHELSSLSPEEMGNIVAGLKALRNALRP
jgi:DNA-binding MarR family transcriptional regulator